MAETREQFEKIGVFALPIIAREFDQPPVATVQHVRAKEIGRVKGVREILTKFPLDDRCELEQIPESDDLNAAERKLMSPTIQTQRAIDRIQDVSPHHRDLIDDQRIQLFKQPALLR